MFVGVLVAVLCIIVLYQLRKKWKNTDYGIDGLSGPSILQMFVHIYRNRRHIGNVLKLLHGIHEKYGPTYTIHIKPFLPVVITSDHNYFDKILASKACLQKPPAYDCFKGMVDESIVTTHDLDIWRNDRKLLNEAFGHESFKVFLEQLDQKVHQLEEMLLEKMEGPIDFQDVLHKFILHTSVDSFKDPNIPWDHNRTIQYWKSRPSFINNAIKILVLQTVKLDFFLNFTQTGKILEKARKVIRQFGIDLVDAHIKAKDKQTDPNNIIYRLHEAGVPYDRIVDNAILFIEAAHETVATSIAYAIFEIANHSDIQNKICAEINEIIGSDSNATILPADLQQMKYLECVVKETLRRHSTFSYVMRILEKPVTIDEVTIPQGTTIVFFIDALHKSEKYYKNPLVFDPDRFSEENKQNLVPNTWTPFSLGIRNCIGKTLAVQKMMLVIAKIIRRFEISPVVPEHVLDISATFFTKSINGVPVNIQLRKR